MDRLSSWLLPMKAKHSGRKSIEHSCAAASRASNAQVVKSEGACGGQGASEMGRGEEWQRGDPNRPPRRESRGKDTGGLD